MGIILNDPFAASPSLGNSGVWGIAVRGNSLSGADVHHDLRSESWQLCNEGVLMQTHTLINRLLAVAAMIMVSRSAVPQNATVAVSGARPVANAVERLDETGDRRDAPRARRRVTR